MDQAQASSAGEVTRLLGAWRSGDAAAPDTLLNLVYQELKGIAAHRLARLGAQVIAPTELVNEAMVRLLSHTLDAQNREHFFRIVATAIRYTLVDTVRRQQADKRGGGAVAITLSGVELWASSSTAAGEQWLEVEEALRMLEQHDPRACRIVELAFLVGLSQQEIANTLAISLRTVERELRFAKAWLREYLES